MPLLRSRRSLLAAALTALLATAALGTAGPDSLAAARAPAAEPAASGLHTVVLVRHAEKELEGGADPRLSPRGRERAARLAELLAASGVGRLVASEFRRTQETLAPLATVTGLAVEVRPARELAALAQELRALPAGSRTVVAGHSNTVPALVRALGGEAPDELPEDAYDRLFVVTLGGDEGAATLELRYGAER